LGDILGIRIGGNVVGPKVLGCVEYGCAVAGAKLVVVMGHSKSTMVAAAVDECCQWHEMGVRQACPSLDTIISTIGESIDLAECAALRGASAKQKEEFVEKIAVRNVLHSLHTIYDSSDVLRRLVDEGRVAMIGAIYDVPSGEIRFLADDAMGLTEETIPPTRPQAVSIE
jgi:carbonic anhydrase/SulP family sulfate permease